jgi:hypothetical protein
MTDVHGEPQQGGYLPAEIWHAYMAAVTEGQKCSEFPPPTEPLVYQPFFGKYESAGRSSQANENSEESFGGKESKREKKILEKAKLPHTTGPGQGGGGVGSAGGGGNGGGGNGNSGTGTPAPNAGGPSEEPATPGGGGNGGGGGGGNNGNGGNTGGAAPGH